MSEYSQNSVKKVTHVLCLCAHFPLSVLFEVFIWNSMTGEELKYVQAHRGSITDMQFTDDRMMMIT